MRRRGFTLIELMIYMGLSSVVLAGVMGVESVVRHSTLRQGLRLAIHQDRLRVGDWFRRDVARAVRARVAAGGALDLDVGGGQTVLWSVEQGRLVRRAGQSRQLLGRAGAARFTVEKQGDRYLVGLRGTLSQSVPGLRLEEPLDMAGLAPGGGK